jgi:membrane protein YqaA with SNARE-associated domain
VSDAAPPHGRFERWGEHPAGPALLFGSAVLEGCLFPAPTEALFAALALARPRRSALLAAVATAGSVAGGALGYLAGAALWDSVARPVLAWWGLEGSIEGVGAAYRRHLPLALLTSGYTPIPYLLYAIGGGALGVSFPAFVAWSLAGRGIKFALLAVATRWLGPALHRLWAKVKARRR